MVRRVREKFFSLKGLLAISVAAGLFIVIYFVYPVFATPPSTPYAPGETTDPSCAPGDTNCTVTAPLPTTLTADASITMNTYALNFGTGTLYIDSARGRVGIGTIAPEDKLTISGGNLTVGNSTATSTLTGTSFVVASSSANHLGKFYVDSSGNVSASGTLTIAGATNYSGLTGLIGGFIANASSSIGSSLNVTGNLNASSTFFVSGLSNFIGGFLASASSSIGGTLSVTGATTVSSTLSVVGLTTLQNGFISSASSSIGGSLQVSGNLSANYLAIASSTSNRSGLFNVDSSGNVAASGTLVIFGNSTLGGFISSASSSVNAGLNVQGNLSASGTITGPASSVWNSTGLGIFTSPSFPLDVAGVIRSKSSIVGQGLIATQSTPVDSIIIENTASGAARMYVNNTVPLYFGVNSVSKMTLRSDGDLFITDGTTSSTISANSLSIASSTTNGLGKFYVDSSGNVNASGTLTLTGNIVGTSNSIVVRNSLNDNITLLSNVVYLQPNNVAALSAGTSYVQTRYSLYPGIASYNSVDNGVLDFPWRNGWYAGALYVGAGTATSSLTGTDFSIATSTGFKRGKFYVDSSGNATASGTFKTHDGTYRMTVGGYGSNAAGYIIASNVDPSLGIRFHTDAGAVQSIKAGALIVGSNYALSFPTNGAQIEGNVAIGNGASGVEKLSVAGSGSFGAGTTTSTIAGNNLAIASSTSNRVGIFYVDSSGNLSASGTGQWYGGSSTGGFMVRASNSTTTLVSRASGAGAGAFVLDTSSTLTIASSSVLFSLRNNGNKVFSIDATGYVAASGTVNANIATASIGDFAEYINVALGETVEAGDVMVIDGNGINQYKKSSEANSNIVAGVISDTGAFVIGSNGENRAPMAMAGLVYTKVTDENGPIVPGDYLVSASKPGYAMKYDVSKANSGQVGIVGTAVEGWSQGDGKIKVLVRGGGSLSVSISQSGQLVQSGDLDLGGNSILNVKALIGLGNLWSIDESGKLLAKEVKADKGQFNNLVIATDQDPQKSSIGMATILAGSSSITVANSLVSSTSKIFVTFRGNPQAFWWVANQIDGQFDVVLSQAATQDVSFDYWLVGVEASAGGVPTTSLDPGEPLVVPPTSDTTGTIEPNTVSSTASDPAPASEPATPDLAPVTMPDTPITNAPVAPSTP